MKRVFSAMRPTGRLHLGHYFGALDNWIKLQKDYECFYGIADWHALTTNFEAPDDIRENTRQLLLDWLSTGVNTEKSVLFVQSKNLAHAELYLLLGMITPVAWLERTPTYKEMQAELSHKDLANYGFLGYPVLMTSDIIIYNAAYVPVGIDQVPHVELSREIVRRFHTLYNKEVFVEPQALLTKQAKLPGLDGRKMSKSYDNSVMLSDIPEVVEKKLKTMVTDTNRKKRSDPGDPECCPVYPYHDIFSTEDEKAEVTAGCKNAGIGCLDCKKILINHVLAFLAPIREKRTRLEREITDADEYLADSQKKAGEEAEKTVAAVREAIKI
ncbi:MAG: tryptophan--tRNA ligase [Deferribacteraceae bacterium]|nr:tryptophan--tRNA ligase [Deferribacteraceae bacterium]